MDYGLYTREMGYRLYKKYENTPHMVFCAHGKDKEKEPYYCHPTPFFGKYSRATTLSFVDIIVINRNNNQIELIAEIEENAAEPKKVIGDIVNIILSEKVRIREKDYKYGDMVFILGVKSNPKGSTKEKTKLLCKKLAEVNEKIGNKRMDLIPLFDDDLEKLNIHVESEIDRNLTLPDR
jgi:hypothetical protein